MLLLLVSNQGSRCGGVSMEIKDVQITDLDYVLYKKNRLANTHTHAHINAHVTYTLYGYVGLDYAACVNSIFTKYLWSHKKSCLKEGFVQWFLTLGFMDSQEVL